MNKSESIAALASALAKAQPAIEGATKDKNNPAFRSKYADLASVTEAIASPLASHGLSYVQVSHDRENAAVIETIILHSSGEWLGCGPVAVPVSKHDAHGFGSALTYARRYSLSSAFGVVPEDDDGNGAARAAPKTGAITPTTGAWESQSPDMQDALQQFAREINNLVASGAAKAAVDAIDAKESSWWQDEMAKVAFWTLLDSKTRSTLKRAKEEAGMLKAAAKHKEAA